MCGVGVPARHDQVDDPALAEALLTARRGTAYFTRKLGELTDEQFTAPSLLPGWSRAHVIAHVGYNARALTRLLEWASTGIETPMYAGPEQRAQEIEDGATLTPAALRHLVTHSAVHLNVEWRDLPADRWTAPVRTAQGRTVPVAETAWLRTREVWLHAIDLNNGATFTDLPPEVIDRLLQDVTHSWRQREQGLNLILNPTDRPTTIPVSPANDQDAITVTGTAADLTRWATGRGRRGLTTTTTTGADIPAAPRWL
jgi:maleylpyruvate isomerase